MESATITCTNCQTVNPAKNQFCQSCGVKLVQPPPKFVETISSNAELPPLESTVNLNKPASAASPVPPPPANVDPFAPLSSPPPAAPPGYFPTQVYPQQNMPPQGNFPTPGNFQTQTYPPQGMPPQGGPPQGMPPQGFPPAAGMPPQGGYPPPQGGYPPQPGGLPPQGFAPQGGAGQQVYYPPQVAAPVPGIERLGVRADGWMDLIAGEAGKAAEIEKTFVDELKARDIPLVNIDRMEFNAGFNKKPYQVAHHPAGAVAVNVEAVGKDLVCSWALYTPQIPNWKMIGILAGIAFGVSFLTSLGTIGNFGFFFVQWVFGTFGWLWQVALVALLAGQIWKGSWQHFFLVGASDSTKESLAVLVLAVHQSLLAAVEKAGLDSSRLRGK